MTNETAKRKIEMLDSYLQRKNDYGESDHEAMMMAIEALSQESCEDAISREDAMSMILCYGNEIKAEAMDDIKASMIKLPPVQPKPIECEDAISRAEAVRVASGYCHPSNIAKELAKLPPVQPIRPKGHWILTDDDFVYCSECEDSYYPRPIDASWYYCPHCGAKMIDVPDINDGKLSEISTGSESEET